MSEPKVVGRRGKLGGAPSRDAMRKVMLVVTRLGIVTLINLCEHCR